MNGELATTTDDEDNECIQYLESLSFEVTPETCHVM